VCNMHAAPRLVLLCFRVGLALLTSTFFQPDEYYQSLEVAHHAVFGYGYLTWEWTTQHPVRSPVYPAVYAIVYQVVKALGLDDTRVLVSVSLCHHV
jgi:phosphatidylinositol glycan class B